MAKQFISLTTRIDLWKDYFNNLTNDVGDIALLTTGASAGGDSDLVTAINEHDAELGTITAVAMGTTASTVSTAIAELDGRLDSINDTQINSPHLFITDSSQTSIIKGNLNLHGNMDIDGTLTVDGVVNFKAGSSGSVTLGDANTDNVVFNADINSSIIPNTDDTYDLGSSSQEWRDLFVDRFAYIDRLRADSATFTGLVTGTGASFDSANITTAGIVTLDVTGITTLDSATVDGWLTSSKIRSSGAALRLEDGGNNINLTANGTLFGSFSTPDNSQLVITNGSSDTITLQADGDLALSGTGDFVPGVTLNTTATGVGRAINELLSSITLLEGTDSNVDSSLTAIFSQIGDLASLNGDSKDNLVNAINETWDRIPNIYDENDTLLNG